MEKEKIENFCKEKLNIDNELIRGEDNSFIISLYNSDEFGKIYSKLENSNFLNQLDENTVVTDQGSSLLYKADDANLLINLTADWDGDIYKLVINDLGE